MMRAKRAARALVAFAAVGIVAWLGPALHAQGPQTANTKLGKLAPGEPTHRERAGMAASAPVSLNYATGFEVAQGFTARDATCQQNACVSGGIGDGSGGTGFTGQCGFIGDGTQGSGPYPEPWGVSSTNLNNIEGHIDIVHPFSGMQHLRISKDACDSTNAFSFAVDARIPPSPPLPGLIAPSTYSGQIAIGGLFGANVNWQPQSNSQGLLTSRVLFFFYGFIYILDDYCGFGITFVPVFTYWDATGVYQEFTVHHDPCAKFRCVNGGPNCGGACPNGTIDCRVCVGGTNDTLPCVGNFQCPGGACDGGDCLGRVEYRYGGELIYTGSQFAGTSSEQFLIYTDNFAGETDVDDLSIETGTPCPVVCGDLEITGTEECDGLNDDACPGRCVGAGMTGPSGQAECTCVIATCLDCDGCAEEVLNGTNTAIAHGQWWTFTAETPATAIELCGSDGFDSYLAIWTGSCNTLVFVAGNDDCDSSTAFGPGSDPLASCFNRGGVGSVGGPYESCTCIDTVIGQQYWASVYGADAAGNVTNITLTKRLTCGDNSDFGACTDCLGNCTDNVLAAGCMNAGDVFAFRKTCVTATASPTCGACCDAAPGLGGACTDLGAAADCTGTDQAFSLGVACADIPGGCNEITGACCDGVSGTCTITVRDNCPTSNQSTTWTKGAACDGSCTTALGACCNYINPDPLAPDGTCTDGVTYAECAALADSVWTKNTACSAVSCPASPPEPAIPTVSEWGLVVLALLLVIVAKVAFSRRREGQPQ